MGETKEYITQTAEEGEIHISQDVVANIAGIAAAEVEGVFALSGSQSSDFSERFGKKSCTKGIRICAEENNELRIECNIIALYGYSIVTLAKSVQDSVCSAIESMTALKVASVDVNVCSISMKK